MNRERNFTEGKILSPLIRFMVPVFLAMFLQATYGAVDLLIVGQFAHPVDVSAVSTGSQIMMTLTNLVISFAMGTTILLGQRIGEGRGREGGQVIGSSVCLFGVIAGAFTILIPVLSRQLSSIMNAPAEAFDETCSFIRICGLGSLFIIAYNLIGSIFRGIGDSKTPLMTVTVPDLVQTGGQEIRRDGIRRKKVLIQILPKRRESCILRETAEQPFRTAHDFIPILREIAT